MDSRLWSESHPEPAGERQVVLSARIHFGCLKTQLAITAGNEFTFVKLNFDLQPHSSASGNLRSGIRSVVGAKLWRFILL